MKTIIDLDKSIASSRIQPEIFRIKRKLKESNQPDYVAIIKGTEIEMVCINKVAWEDYQRYRLNDIQSKKRSKRREFSDQEISDGFSNIAGQCFLEKEPPMSQEEYDYYMSL